MSAADVKFLYHNLYQIVDYLTHYAQRSQILGDVHRLVLSTSVYMIWRERNQRFHTSAALTADVISGEIVEILRYHMI